MRPKNSFPIALAVSYGLSFSVAVAGTTSGAERPEVAPVQDDAPAGQQTQYVPVMQDAQGPQSAADADDDDGAPPQYPHITTLEKIILGQAYPQEQLAARLSRMEVKAFGTASGNLDLSSRTDALDDYVQKTLHKQPYPGMQDAQGQQSAADADDDGGDSVPGQYPHVTTLEKEILGQAYPQDQLAARLSRMEVKAFGASSDKLDLSSRTDALDDYAQKALHKQSFDKQQAQQAAKEGYVTAASGGGGGTTSGGSGNESGSSGGHKAKAVASFLGRQLLGMAVPIPGLGNTIAGVRAVPASSLPQQDLQSSQPQTPPEDPAVYSDTPPPAGARTITQVGWCEMRVFGHTSPQLHLAERLDQLNLQLNFAPKQKGIELMDDVPKLMQMVQARGH